MRPLFFVRIGGLEPPRLSPLDPKSSAATNYAISAFIISPCYPVSPAWQAAPATILRRHSQPSAPYRERQHL